MTSKLTTAPITPADFAALGPILEATGLFPPELLPDLVAEPPRFGAPPAIWRVAYAGAECAGLVYARPETFTEGTWNMLALAVAPERQGQGFGTALVQALEGSVKAADGRLLIVDTAGIAEFDGARAFYAARGFALVARIPDFWAQGVDKVTFSKTL